MKDKEFYKLVCNDRFSSIEDKISDLDTKVDTKFEAVLNKLDDKTAPLIKFRFKTLGAISVLMIVLPLMVSFSASWYFYENYKKPEIAKTSK